MQLFCRIFSTLVFLLVAVMPARADDLDYPTFRNAAPVALAVSQIVIRNDSGHIANSRLLDRGRLTGDEIERYLRARLKASGNGPVLSVTVESAEVIPQGRTELGNAREHIDIALSIALVSPDGLTAQKKAYVEAKRTTTGTGSRLGNLPIDSRNDDMGDVIRILDKRLLTALRHELGVLN